MFDTHMRCRGQLWSYVWRCYRNSLHATISGPITNVIMSIIYFYDKFCGKKELRLKTFCIWQISIIWLQPTRGIFIKVQCALSRIQSFILSSDEDFCSKVPTIKIYELEFSVAAMQQQKTRNSRFWLHSMIRYNNDLWLNAPNTPYQWYHHIKRFC